MKQNIAHITLLVNDYDETIAFYTQQLQFSILENIHGEDGRRWVTLAPKGNPGSALALIKAETPAQKERVGNQTGGGVSFFLNTDNIERDLNHFRQQQVTITREIVDEPWGKVAIFADLYGNLWDLIESA
ncbi:VOC family protein [Flavobacterium cerinum]|uniref:VOC family protein n=1 Tax=Flavobacterium cerinum TaxID=2502784 RepID=A0ABY5IXS2_9FLAO|nr:VOC family protein [Flavobacterium cerinum]UUC46144.1 VOC family protein [Flavobacterium cerinum]